MPADLLSALPAAVLFALVTTITPGPNNTMLLASGVNFGLKRTVPHLLGISAGVAFLMLAVGLGLAQAFERFAWLYTVLETASVVYLLYLAWKIGTSSSVQARDGERRPMRFYEAVAFQWVNPKAWMMVLTAATTIHLHASLSLNAALMALVFIVVGLPCITSCARSPNTRYRLAQRGAPASISAPQCEAGISSNHTTNPLCRCARPVHTGPYTPARNLCSPACKFGTRVPTRCPIHL